VLHRLSIILNHEKREKMNEQTEILVPPIDHEVPEHLETATFALG